MNPEAILLAETRSRVRFLRMNRPDTKKALSNDLIRALMAAWKRGRVLLGPGPKPQQAGRSLAGFLGRVGYEKPVIAGIDGIAIGAGLSLAMCADMRTASSGARFHPGSARIGTWSDVGLTWTRPATIGHERALRFALQPRAHDADAALALGLVGEVVDAAGSDAAFVSFCEEIAGLVPLPPTHVKCLVNRIGVPADLEAHLRDEPRFAERG
jgi:enoyl-CoA hydratase/carnithine racemase